MRILHFSDLHLRDKDIEEAEKCLDVLAETAEREDVDLIVNAGDTFDSRDIKLDSRAAKLAVKTFNRLADICPVCVVIGTPSHDGNAAEILSYVRGLHPIHVASIPQQITVKLRDAVKLVVTMMPQPTKQYFQGTGEIQKTDADIANAMSALFAGFGVSASNIFGPHILIGHWNTTGAYISDTQILTGVDIEIAPDQMMLANPAIVMLGHIHKQQKIGSRVYYAGSLYANNWGETDDKGFYIHEIAQDITSRFIKGPSRKLVRQYLDKTAGEEEDRFCFSSTEIDGAYVRLDVTVWQDEAGIIDKENLSRGLKALGAIDVDIRINRVPRQNVRSAAVLKAETLAEKIMAMAELRGETVPETILEKAESLEITKEEHLIEYVTKGVAA